MNHRITIVLAVFVVGLLASGVGPVAAQDSPDTAVDQGEQPDTELFTDGEGIVNQTGDTDILSLLELLFESLDISVSISG